MGNYISCALFNHASANNMHSPAPMVIFPNGEIRQFQEPTMAAELMLEIPNFFLVNAKSLCVGQRFSPLNADEELEMANVYVMFPMKKVNSIAAASDLALLYLASRSTAGRNKVLPEPSSVAAFYSCQENEANPKPKLNLEDMEEFSTPEFTHRRLSSMTRSRKPSLDTIAEEPAVVVMT